MCELEFLLNHLLLTLSCFILLRFVGLRRIVLRNIKFSECGQCSWHWCMCIHYYLYVGFSHLGEGVTKYSLRVSRHNCYGRQRW